MCLLPELFCPAELQAHYEALLDCLGACRIAVQTIKDHKPPIAPTYVPDIGAWALYRQAVEDYQKQLNALHDAGRQLDKKREEHLANVRKFIPAKGIWFRLPGTDNWLAKTSNNLTDSYGMNLHEHTGTFHSLPKLTTL